MKSLNNTYLIFKEKTDFACVSDSLISGFCAFLFSAFILNYFSLKFILKICISVISGLAVCFLVFTAKNKKYAKNVKLKSDKKQLKNILSALEIMPDNELIALFSSLFNKAEIPHETKKDRIITKSTSYFFDFNAVTDRKTACEKIRKSKTQKTALFLVKATDDLINFEAERKDIFRIIDATELFKLIKKYRMTFPAICGEQTFSEKAKRFKILFFTKKRAVTLCFSSALLLFFSMFSFYPFYYRLFGFILLILAVLCLIFGKNKQDSKSELPCDFT